MKKLLLMILFLMIACPSITFAHKPLLMVDDNGDGTIYVETGYSDGSSGAGHSIKLKDAATGKILSELKIPEEGSLDIKKPSIPYIVVFDGGEGHTVEAKGPPPSSESKVDKQLKEEPEQETIKIAATVQNPETSNTEKSSVTADVGVPQPVGVGHGITAAYKMMIWTQVFTSIGVLLIFGVLMFGIGQRWERNRRER